MASKGMTYASAASSGIKSTGSGPTHSTAPTGKLQNLTPAATTTPLSPNPNPAPRSGFTTKTTEPQIVVPPIEPRRHSPPAHTRNAAHIPHTSVEETEIYVLTLSASAALQSPIDTLRSTHFPVSILKVPAHLSLFRALPGSKLQEITREIEALCAGLAPIHVTAGRVLRMNKGVALTLDGSSQRACKGRVWETLVKKWGPFLSEQDRENWRAHWTVVNKVNGRSEEGKRLLDAAAEDVEKLVGKKGLVDGVVLWRFQENGRWGFVRRFEFVKGQEAS